MHDVAEPRRLARASGLSIRARVALVVLATGTALRAVLAVQAGILDEPRRVLLACASGVAQDALVGCALIAPLLALLELRRAPVRRSTARVLLFLALWAFGFLTFVEYFFFEEFDARFNHLALDYLLFPGEVAGNVWESYPVPVFVALSGAAAALAAWWVLRAPGDDAPRPRPRRALAAALLAAFAWGALALGPKPDLGDRRSDELASNDLRTLVHAVRTASLDYESYYRTVSDERLQQVAARELGWSGLDRPLRTYTAQVRRDEPLDVVVILGESFGSEFVGSLGGTSPCAPGLERWAPQGLLLTNLMATGNRTVRGLEGVLCSFVPLPGDSIWKRDRSQGVATIADVLRRQDYRTEFLYGGDGAFDGMRSFALANGWEAFLDDSLLGGSSFPSEAFRTVWGAADEHLFELLLERQRSAAREGRRYFGTALTVSNHKPFLTPDSHGVRVRTGKLASMAPWLGFLLSAGAAGSWWLRRRRGNLRASALAAGVVALLGLVTWSEIHPKDTRVSAVAYADRALASYLDRAREEGLLEHTVVLFVGDHGARVYGSEAIPAASYRVPALFLAPDRALHGRTLARLASQVDLAPTLLSIAGVDYSAPFFGTDLLAGPDDGPGRAWLIHNRDVGYLTDRSLTVLGLQGRTSFYRRSDRTVDTFDPTPSTPGLEAAADDGAAVFQIASALYEQGRYRLPDAP